MLFRSGLLPPLVGEVENFTLVPEQIVLAVALSEIVTAGMTLAFTVIILVLDVAEVPDTYVAQVAFDINTHVMESLPLPNEFVE